MNVSNLTILSASDGVSLKSRANFLYQLNFKTPKSKKEELNNKFRFGGHLELRENLIRGLYGAGIDFDLRNRVLQNANNNIGLLAGKELLRKLTQIKEPKQLNVVAGPNLFVSPKSFGFELQNKIISQIIVPSVWVADLYKREVPEISHKITIWASGINFDYWKPSELPEIRSETKVLVYVKNGNSIVVNQVKNFLRKKGLQFKLISYGYYSKETYRNELRESDALIYIGSSESQGIAILEAWAMNVPTFVYDSKESISIPSELGDLILPPSLYSAAPYLTEERGKFWSNTCQLEDYLSNFGGFNPRDASKVFSDKNCAIEYVKLFIN